jgi:hypothetical protein
VIICESDDSDDNVNNSNIKCTIPKAPDHLDLTNSQPNIVSNKIIDKSKTENIIVIVRH